MSGERGAKRIGFRSAHKRKSCPLISAKITEVDYKDLDLLMNFMAQNCSMLPARVTGVLPRNQRKVKQAIRRARVMALLPFKTV